MKRLVKSDFDFTPPIVTSPPKEEDVKNFVFETFNAVVTGAPLDTKTDLSNDTTPNPSDEIFVEYNFYKHTLSSPMEKDLIRNSHLTQLTSNNAWIGTSIVQFWLALLEWYINSPPNNNPKIFIVHSWFIDLLKNGKHKSNELAKIIKRKTNGQMTAIDFNLLFIPVNENNTHWTLAVIDNRDRKIRYYDSLLEQKNDQFRKQVLDLIVENLKQCSLDGYEIEIVKTMPQQPNGTDCGLYMLKVADLLAQQKPLEFDQTNISAFRKQILQDFQLFKNSKTFRGIQIVFNAF